MYDKYIKRLFDLICAVCMLVILSPIFLIVAVLIAGDSGLPIIYKQRRVGKDCKDFKVYKFRTMVTNADKIGPLSTGSNDSRITKIGKVLRKTSLDELPQLVNVIKGDMSLIGYRPDVRREDTDSTEKKYMVRPGITGYAQVNGRSLLNEEQKKYWEDKYVDDISFITDIKILFATVKVVLGRSGTN